jgi:three-Cys-motif partner protein
MTGDDLRLFDPEPSAGKPRLKRPERPRLVSVDLPPPDPQVRLSSDGAGWAAASDGLPARVVKDHSAEKAWAVSRDLDTVGRAMVRQWFPVNYLELYSGPGLLYNEGSGEEMLGSPLEALLIKQPFSRYVFSDVNPTCTEALKARVRSESLETRVAQTDVLVRHGDANDRAYLDELCALIDPLALVIAYLDPAKPNLHWSTVEYLAARFAHLDLLINLPFSAIHRALSVGHTQGPALMLNDPNPLRFLASDEGRASRAIRDHYRDQLRQLGFPHIAWRSVLTRTTRSPLYDVILASRNWRAVDLFEKANRVTESGQLGLDLA